MNVIITNLNRDKFINLDVDVIKSISGEFTAEELVQSFSNFFFNRMFLDITAVKDYTNIENIRKLSIGLDVSKIILYLSDEAVVNSDGYISALISMGLYNFAKSDAELKYLYDNPNAYKDVAHLQKITSTTEQTVVANLSSDTKVIGFKNFTNHAGSTSLIYMIKKQLVNNYHTIAIEVNKRDFIFYDDKEMVSCKESELSQTIANYNNAKVILIDLNDTDLATAHTICTDILYVMESSTLMINKLVMLDNNCFNKAQNYKVVLNRSLLNEKDLKQLEYETGLNFFAVLPPMNDREDNSMMLMPMLEKLELYKRN